MQARMFSRAPTSSTAESFMKSPRPCSPKAMATSAITGEIHWTNVRSFAKKVLGSIFAGRLGMPPLAGTPLPLPLVPGRRPRPAAFNRRSLSCRRRRSPGGVAASRPFFAGSVRKACPSSIFSSRLLVPSDGGISSPTCFWTILLTVFSSGRVSGFVGSRGGEGAVEAIEWAAMSSIAIKALLASNSARRSNQYGSSRSFSDLKQAMPCENLENLCSSWIRPLLRSSSIQIGCPSVSLISRTAQGKVTTPFRSKPCCGTCLHQWPSSAAPVSSMKERSVSMEMRTAFESVRWKAVRL
mmetsp:Transcript_6509/g.19065  ORF Transcript_6509/g.19065 Transcript_6509/m.19065 type:complete len:297 (+) Transcript_6509:471-1361(+)